MAVYLRIVVCLYDGSRSISNVGDDLPSILVPCPLHQLEFVRVDPSVEDVLVLILVVSMDGRDGTYE